MLVLIAAAQWLWQPVVGLVVTALVGAGILTLTSINDWIKLATAEPGSDTWRSSDGWSMATSPWAWPAYLLALLGIAKRLRDSSSRSRSAGSSV